MTWGWIMVMVGMETDTQRAGYLGEDHSSVGGGIDIQRAGTWGRIMVLVGVG